MKKTLLAAAAGILAVAVGCGGESATEPSPTKQAVDVQFTLNEARPPNGTAITSGVMPGQFDFLWFGYRVTLTPFEGLYTACALRRDDGRTYIQGIAGPYQRPSYDNDQCSIHLLGGSGRASAADFARGHTFTVDLLVGDKCMVRWGSSDTTVDQDCVKAKVQTGLTYTMVR